MQTTVTVRSLSFKPAFAFCFSLNSCVKLPIFYNKNEQTNTSDNTKSTHSFTLSRCYNIKRSIGFLVAAPLLLAERCAAVGGETAEAAFDWV